mgnify:CR=1 FL=1
MFFIPDKSFTTSYFGWTFSRMLHARCNAKDGSDSHWDGDGDVDDFFYISSWFMVVNSFNGS